MKNLSVFTIVATLLSSLLIYSCVNTESQALDSSDILGKWTLKEAFRGGKATSTLENIYFEFNENGKVSTNFNLEGEDQKLGYEVKEGTIIMKGGENLNIKAEKDLDGNLTFNTSLRNYKFKLVLEPAKEEEEG